MNNLNNKKILITGGAGFIGSNLLMTLEKEYPDNDYFVIDNFISGSPDNLKGFKGEVFSGSVEDMNLEEVLPGGVDAIFHQASITDTTVEDEERMMNANFESLKNVLDFSLKNNCPLVYASSAAVYGNSSAPMRVGEGEEPTNIYGESKLRGDKLIREYFKKDTVPIIGLRYFNVYGPREKYKGKMASMIWQLYKQIKEGKKPKIFEHGEQKRDQVYVKDVVQANILAYESKKSGIFNVGTGEAVSFNEIIENINKVLEIDLEPEYIKNPYDFYQDFTKADISKTEKELGYRPKYNLEKGIDDYIKTISS